MAEAKRQRSTTRITWILLGITLLGLFLFVGSIGLTAWLFSRTPRGEVAEGSWLVVELEGPISDAPMQGGLFVEPDQFPPIVTELSAAIRKASTDERITGIYLVLDEPMVGWGGAQEIRDALGDFRAAGKPCVAYSELYTTKSYYLATSCDRVVLAPSGISFVSGLSVSVTYFAETFEKLGVQPELEHVGDFKSAVEPFQRTGPSESAAIAYEEMLDSLYGQVVKGIAEGRHMEEAEVRSRIDNLQLSPQAALDAGLVDALAFPDAITATLPGLLEDNWRDEVVKLHPPLDEEELAKRLTMMGEYIKEVRADQRSADKIIAVIHADGEIQSGDGEPNLFGEAMLTDGAFKGWMRQAREDERVVAVVLRVNSPGGSGLASDMMWHEVERTKAAGKPVVVSMGDYAASGGYFIACNADWIVAQPGTLTGSIGVFGGKFNLAGTYDKIGLHQAEFKRGEMADLLSTSEPFTEAGRAAFRQYLETFYGVFVGKVADGRKLDRETVHAVAQGRVWTGEQALHHKLVDQMGGLDDALAKAADLAGATDYGVARWPEQKSFFDLLMEDLSSAQAPTIKVELPSVPGTEEALEQVMLLDAMAGEQGVLAYQPELRVE